MGEDSRCIAVCAHAGNSLFCSVIPLWAGTSELKKHIPVILALALLAGIAVSCGDGDHTTDPRYYHQMFWLNSDSGHAKQYFIQVALPRSYYRQKEKTYPVIYLTDADYCFNMARDLTVVLNWPQREAIVVGIGYGSPEKLNELRWPEYGDTPDAFGKPGWTQLLGFIRSRLMPYVETRYRINAHNRTLFGWERGAFFATSVLQTDSSLFHNYIIGGGYRDSVYVESLHRARPVLPVNLYFGIGDRDPRYVEAMEFARLLSSREFAGLQFAQEVYPGQGHEIITMGLLLDRGMKWIYERKPLEPRLRAVMLRGGAAGAIREYERLFQTNPDDFEFDPDRLLSFADDLNQEGDSTASAVLRAYVDERYPKHRITVRIRPDIPPPSGVVFITGNHPALGNWDPHAVQMGQPKEGVWSHTFTVRDGTALEYTFTQGSWDSRATDSTGTKAQRSGLTADRDTTVSPVVESWMNAETREAADTE